MNASLEHALWKWLRNGGFSEQSKVGARLDLAYPLRYSELGDMLLLLSLVSDRVRAWLPCVTLGLKDFLAHVLLGSEGWFGS